MDKEKVGIKKLKNPKALIYFSQTIADAYEKLQYYNTMKKKGVLILFNDMIGNMETNKRQNTYSHWIFSERKKTQHFNCFYFKILL